MKRLHLAFIASILALPLATNAQYSQLEPNSTLMFKVELSASPFVSNARSLGDDGYLLPNHENGLGLDVVAGANINEDWFVGGGIGANMYRGANQSDASMLMGATAFADFDFRPVWRPGMQGGGTPKAISFVPMVGARAGAAMLFADEMALSPMVEGYAGVNWYYAHNMRNMSHKWHALYATVGVAYLLETVFVPIRIGWRW